MEEERIRLKVVDNLVFFVDGAYVEDASLAEFLESHIGVS
jgi:hypothetical protein